MIHKTIGNSSSAPVAHNAIQPETKSTTVNVSICFVEKTICELVFSDRNLALINWIQDIGACNPPEHATLKGKISSSLL